MSTAATEEEFLALFGGVDDWKPVPRIVDKIPFGYDEDPSNPKMLLPNVVQLEVLQKAKEYRRRGHSYRRLAQWVSQITGRPISHSGLKVRMERDASLKRKSTIIKRWAERYKETLLEAKEYAERAGEDTHFYDESLASLYEECRAAKARVESRGVLPTESGATD